MKLDDLIRDAKKDTPDVDWKSVDEKVFARIEQEEPRALTSNDEPEQNGRVVWIGAALTLAAAAAALLFVHPASTVVDQFSGASTPQSAGVVAAGDVQGHRA